MSASTLPQSQSQVTQFVYTTTVVKCTLVLSSNLCAVGALQWSVCCIFSVSFGAQTTQDRQQTNIFYVSATILFALSQSQSAVQCIFQFVCSVSGSLSSEMCSHLICNHLICAPHNILNFVHFEMCSLNICLFFTVISFFLFFPLVVSYFLIIIRANGGSVQNADVKKQLLG